MPKIFDWRLLKNGCAYLFHRWAVDSSQLESARSVINYVTAVMMTELQYFKILELPPV